MSGMYDPETGADGFKAFRAWRLHWDCDDCKPGRRCEEFGRLTDAVKAAVQRKLTPYRITWDGGERSAWTLGTAESMAQRWGGKISGGSAGMIQHTENIGDVREVWLTEDDEGKWLNIRAVTAGGITKVYRMPEGAARWLRACVTDAMRHEIADGE